MHFLNLQQAANEDTFSFPKNSVLHAIHPPPPPPPEIGTSNSGGHFPHHMVYGYWRCYPHSMQRVKEVLSLSIVMMNHVFCVGMETPPVGRRPAAYVSSSRQVRYKQQTNTLTKTTRLRQQHSVFFVYLWPTAHTRSPP